MEKENPSSRFPDSSCPDFSYSALLEDEIHGPQRYRDIDTHSSSNTGNNASNLTIESFHNQTLEDENDIDDLLRLTNSPMLNGYHNSEENFADTRSFLSGSSSVVGSLEYLWPSERCLLTNSGPGTSSNTINKEHFSHGPASYTKPRMPFFSSSPSISYATSSQPGISSTTYNELQITPDPTAISSTTQSVLDIPNSVIDNQLASHGSSSIDSTTHSGRSISNAAIVKEHIGHSSPYTKPKMPYINSSTTSSMLSVPTTETVSFTKSSMKRKLSPVLNKSHYLLGVASSSNYVNRDQNMPNNSKKSKVLGSSSYSGLDEDIQILTPEASGDFYNSSNFTTLSHPSSTSSNSGSSRFTAYPQETVITDGNRLSSANAAKQAIPKTEQNQSSRQNAQEFPLLQFEDLQEFLHLPTNLDEITSSNSASSAAAIETITISNVSEGDDSSSSSIVSIHEVLKDDDSSDKINQSSIKSEVPSDIPTVITIDDSPKSSEVVESKTNQEAENVKEDFKKLLEDELICNICTELLIKPVTLGCSHTFCKYCISEWKRKKHQCPMCRAAIATETPCLFLENFISKAVEQLDPASVEKRLEIIKVREDLLKNKVTAPRAPAHELYRSLIQMEPYPHPYPMNRSRMEVLPYRSISRPREISRIREVSRSRGLSNILNAQPSFFQHMHMLNIVRNQPMAHSSFGRHQQSQSRPERQMPLLTPNLPQSSSSIPQPSLSIPQPSSSIPLTSSSIPLTSSSIPLTSSSIPQASSSTQIFSNLQLPQSSNVSIMPVFSFSNTYF